MRLSSSSRVDHELIFVKVEFGWWIGWKRERRGGREMTVDRQWLWLCWGMKLDLMLGVWRYQSRRGVRGAVPCSFRPFLAPHFAVRFSQNHNCTAPHFCGHMCGAVYSLTKTITASHIIFAVTCAMQCKLK